MNKKQLLLIGASANLLTFIIMSHVLFGTGTSWEVPFKMSLYVFSAWILTGINGIAYIYRDRYL